MNPDRLPPYVRLAHPDWCRSAAIYQINTRQFTADGTFEAARAHLPRLKALGVDILWLMPVHPIGERRRKGALGSPYAVRDYYGVNPEFGSLDDLRRFVADVHQRGMRVILDWVANHTAWDHPWVDAHPEWYHRDWKGDFRPTPWWDWDDIIELDYERPEVRRDMCEAMAWWVREVDVDGFRCDVAGYVPVDFWNRVRRDLEAIKPVFMLAEAESRDLHAEAFDMTYAWSWYDAVLDIAQGRAGIESLRRYYAENAKAHPADALRMTFVSNHDKNAWDGTEFEQFGPALDCAIVLSVLGEGMPLIYNGQEAGNPRRLAFFDRDPIVWRDHPQGDLYRRLLALRRRHRALDNGAWGASMIPIGSDAPEQVLSFLREDADSGVLVLLNFSGEPQSVVLREALVHGEWQDEGSGRAVAVAASDPVALSPWGYRVMVRQCRGGG